MKSALIVGCGFLGSELARGLIRSGHSVTGLGRRPAPPIDGIRWVRADLSAALPRLEESIDLCFFTAAPDARNEAAYGAVYLEGLRRVCEGIPESARLLFASSTAVYPEGGRSACCETTPCAPGNFRARILLEAESLVAKRAASGISVRFGGIYGPGRASLIERVRSGEPIRDAGRVANRIHVEDAARLLGFLAERPDPAPVYNGVDDEPAPLEETIRWMAARIGAPMPSGDSPGSAGGGKRVSNRLIRAAGFTFLYPSWREGYSRVISDPRSGRIAG